ncbi:uncharacterized protein LOC133830560 isoform X2 [Humulus lupulus]|uniref:uncharacterized protein LOC133830560 isoform X2 n=1 Tax=Humulus lupulus TaxID=3486 RepID=UPI002B4152A3|nr:uncharacterized protein LOC133830560 isoform X2 [Humulus lupulus]
MLVSSSSLKPPSSSSSVPPLAISSDLNTSGLPIIYSRRNLLAIIAISATPVLILAVNSIPVAAAGGLSQLTNVQLCSGAEKDSKMKPRKEAKRRSGPSSPLKDRTTVSSGYEPRSSGPRSSRLSPPVSLRNQELVTDDSTLFEGLSISEDPSSSSSNSNPRSFPYSVKQQCWEKAEKIKGRDPDRWRRDSLGNIVFRKLVGCPGCLCHDYDHILPYSKGGQSTLENCQVLQATVNRSKGNRTELSRAELIQKSSYCRVSGRDMDLLELSAYGNVRHSREFGGCRIQ